MTVEWIGAPGDRRVETITLRRGETTDLRLSPPGAARVTGLLASPRSSGERYSLVGPGLVLHLTPNLRFDVGLPPAGAYELRRDGGAFQRFELAEGEAHDLGVVRGW